MRSLNMLIEKPKLAQRINNLPFDIQLEIVLEVNDFLERRVTLYEHIQSIVNENHSPRGSEKVRFFSP
jgi:hypothetical protein